MSRPHRGVSLSSTVLNPAPIHGVITVTAAELARQTFSKPSNRLPLSARNRISRFTTCSTSAMATPTLTNPSLTAAVCSLEHRVWAALCSSGSDIIPLLSSNPVMIFPGDMILSSVSSPTVHEMLQGPNFRPWKSYTLSHDEVVQLGKDSALVYYRVEAVRDNETFRAICSSAWVLEGSSESLAGEWKIASHQQTLI